MPLWRWLAGSVAVAVVVIAVIEFSPWSSSVTPPPVVMVLAHATVRVGSPDAVEIVNKGRFWLEGSGYECGPYVTRRTGADFSRPGETYCGGGGPALAPHSRMRVEKSITPSTPGRYWVWWDYGYSRVSGNDPGDLAAEADIQETAHAKLTVVGH